MIIPYEAIGNYLYKFSKNKNIKDFFQNLKVQQNCNFIRKNYNVVLNSLRKKYSNEKIKVAFYVYDETKWKCQSLYDLLEKDDFFEPIILVTRNSVIDTKNPSYQTLEQVEKCFAFFKSKCMCVHYAYDIKKQAHLPFSNFNPDIVIYQHPWYVETSQGPVVCSKFALTYYVPYYFPTTSAPVDYHLRFHQYVQVYCVFDDFLADIYKHNMKNKGINLLVTGQPSLDYFLTASSYSKDYIIYAPHWTVCRQSVAYGTFEWNGAHILKYAQAHPEQKWIFKPHPLLYKALIDNNVMSEDEVEKYYNDWADIGLRYESGDYFELFSKSKLLVTDCSTFLGEFFMTGSPVIHLQSEFAIPYNQTISKIIEHYYKANNLNDLNYFLDNVLVNDVLKNQRMQAIEALGYKNNYAALNILNDIRHRLGR